MLKIPTKYLLLVNGLLWTAIGIKIALIGVDYYGRLDCILWWYYLLSAIVFAGFYVMFTGVVVKYAARIMAMTEPKTSIFKTFSVKGYLIIAFMITLGITLKRIPQVPDSFIAWFYCGLGPGLLSAGIRFILRWWKNVLTPPMEQSNRKRLICLFLCVLCAGIGWLFNFTYRPSTGGTSWPPCLCAL
jgi:Kef-type K+ transport system membrane component KefB